MDTLESVIHLTYFMFPLSVKQNMPVSQLITEEALMSNSNVDVCTVGEIGDEMKQFSICRRSSSSLFNLEIAK